MRPFSTGEVWVGQTRVLVSMSYLVVFRRVPGYIYPSEKRIPGTRVPGTLFELDWSSRSNQRVHSRTAFDQDSCSTEFHTTFKKPLLIGSERRRLPAASRQPFACNPLPPVAGCVFTHNSTKKQRYSIAAIYSYSYTNTLSGSNNSWFYEAH